MRGKAPPDFRAAIIGAVLSSALVAGASSARQTAAMSADHARWIEEEVAYVIAPREREVFEKLATREERERFIEAFWRRRDPNPATPENEFRDEHYRRREHANHFFGRGSGSDGFRTDRGRIYIILGEPAEIRRFDAENDIVPAELWFYRGEPGTGLPAHFHLLFFQKRYAGEYDLYSPAADGPDALVRGATALAADTRRSVERLRLESFELAQASLSFDPTEPVDFTNPRPSLATELLVDRIEDLPLRRVRTDYADAWLSHGDRISAEYSFNFVPSRGVVAVVPGPEGASFVHYGIELAPEDFTLQADESGSRYYTTLDVTLEVTGEGGELVEATEKAIFMELTPSQMEAISRSPIAYHDDFPLLPGRYRTSVVLRNRASKQYTVLQHDTLVPDFRSGSPMLSDLVIGYGSEKIQAESGGMRAFQVGENAIEPAPGSVFTAGEVLHFAFQAVGATSGGESVRMTLADEEETLFERTRALEDFPRGEVVERFSLLSIEGGRYQLGVELRDPLGKRLASRSAEITVSPRSWIPRPRLVRRSSFASHVPGQASLALGNQLLGLGRFDEAVKMLERSVDAGGSELPAAKWQLASALLETGEPERARTLLKSLEPAFGDRFEVVAGLGHAAHQTGSYSEAVAYFERANDLSPAGPSLLNALGESHLHMGQLDLARSAFERSLELDAEQPRVKELVAELLRSSSRNE